MKVVYKDNLMVHQAVVLGKDMPSKRNNIPKTCLRKLKGQDVQNYKDFSV